MITEAQLAQMFQALPEPVPVIPKLYYDDRGRPIEYTTDTYEGNYIEVDPETFAIRPMCVRVVNGTLQHLPPVIYTHKLKPSDSGTMCHNQDVAVVVKHSGTYWKRQTYESN